nr:hypothetical protein [Staphylococcus aureus]
MIYPPHLVENPFIYSRHDRILYVNLVGNRFKNNISMTKATSNIGRGF